MKLTKNIRQYIKIALSAGLLAFPSCSYLDVIPPAQPDFDDTMKDEAATLGFLFTAYSGTSRYTFWREGDGDASLATDEYVEPKDWDWNMQKMLYGTVSAADDIGDWENLYNYIGYVHYFFGTVGSFEPGRCDRGGEGTISCRMLVSRSILSFQSIAKLWALSYHRNKGRSKHPSVRNSGAFAF